MGLANWHFILPNNPQVIVNTKSLFPVGSFRNLLLSGGGRSVPTMNRPSFMSLAHRIRVASLVVGIEALE
jgi:hypothetical protein